MEKQQVQDYTTRRRAALERHYSRMNDMQRKAVFQMEGPLLILAGAGSGKTTVLINRIDYMIRFGNAWHSETVPAGVTAADLILLDEYLAGKRELEAVQGILAQNPAKPWNILAITFTNKAADELKNRLSDSLGSMGADVHASTFHSLCVRILRREIEHLGYARSFTIYDTDDSLRVIKDGLKAHKLDDKTLPPRSVLSAISKAKDEMQNPAAMLELSQNDYRMQCVAKVYGYYQKTLKEANALDFDDLIVKTVELFQEHPAVLEHYQNRYRYIMVDEYQDTNQTQYRLVSLLASRDKNICVVGDDDQSIYKFRGATIENILSFEDQFPGATVIRLEQNYRSTQNILSAANAVIQNNAARKGKNLWTDAGDGPKINVMRLRDEMEEAAIISRAIMEQVEAGGRWSDHAVLYRMNAQSNAVERSLAQHAIPYRIVGGVRFYERKEIKDVVAYLSVLNNPDDTLRLLRIINEPKRQIGPSTMTAAQEIAATIGEGLFHVIEHANEYAPLSKKERVLTEFAYMMRRMMQLADEAPLDQLLDELLEQSGYLRSLESQGIEGAGRIENVMELKTNMIKYQEENEDTSLAGFLEEISLYTDLDNYDRDADAVTLMTVHSAKGLEFGHVYIAGMDEGIFPGRSAINFPEEIEEERRLAYVAITRAKEQLTVTTAERRMLFGQTTWGRPSRFVGEIPDELIERKESSRQRTPMKKQAEAPSVSASGTSVGVGSGAPTDKSDVTGVGDRVRHKVFGEGVIRSAKSMGNDTLLEVEFDKAGTKKIMANFARLQKV